MTRARHTASYTSSHGTFEADESDAWDDPDRAPDPRYHDAPLCAALRELRERAKPPVAAPTPTGAAGEVEDPRPPVPPTQVAAGTRHPLTPLPGSESPAAAPSLAAGDAGVAS